MSEEYVLETHNLVKEFKGFVAVDDVNLNIRKGHIHALGIDVVERVELHVGRNPHNEHYLDTKQSKLGHFLEIHQDDYPQR